MNTDSSPAPLASDILHSWHAVKLVLHCKAASNQQKNEERDVAYAESACGRLGLCHQLSARGC
jgi:hypothetical protein